MKRRKWRIIWKTSGVSPPGTHVLHEHILKSNNVTNSFKENTAGTTKKNSEAIFNLYDEIEKTTEQPDSVHST